MEKNNVVIANCITVSRILFSFLLLVFSPSSYYFAVFYLLCGITDVLDGFVARKLHTESKRGAMLDSMADLFFAVIYAVRILPVLSVPFWIWIWTVIIAVVKTAEIIMISRKEHGLYIEHSFRNKLTGILVFLLPLSTFIADVKYGATLVCTVATLVLIKEITNICRNNRYC